MITFDWNSFNKDEAIAQMKERLRLNARMSRGFARAADHAPRATADCGCGGHDALVRPVLGGISTPAAINARNAAAHGRQPALPPGFTADAGLTGPGQVTPASMNIRASAVWGRKSA